MNQITYPERVKLVIKKHTGLCIGLDPSPDQLLSWDISDDLAGLSIFCDRMVSVCLKAKVGFVKPQSAFFERFGWKGLQILAETNKILRDNGIFTIFDGKRGDIGSTAAAYAQAYLSGANQYDAMTVNPFLGYETLSPFVEILKHQPVGIFIVVRSSNPDGHIIQNAITDSHFPVATMLGRKIQAENEKIFGKTNLGSIGAVIGATLPLPSVSDLLDTMSSAFFLCPGIGAQGASLDQALNTFKKYLPQCIFPLSRGITLNCPSEHEMMMKIKKLQENLAKNI
jgi:orotidine-5'-phosphate decarboxylase